MAEVRMEKVSMSFGATKAVSDMTLDIPDGSFVVLLGPTGAGKTTTLRLIAGLEAADDGKVHIGGQDVSSWTPSERNTTMVFQQFSLYPHLSVRDNLAFPLRSPLRPHSEQQVGKIVADVAQLLHIEDKLDNKTTQLSGGEMQRVSLGKALVRQPAISLMDEPLASLDASLRAELRIELKRIQAELEVTVLYVTHDQVEAMTMATAIGVLREGRLVQFASPREIYEDPSNVYVATRLGLPGINIVPAALFPDLALPGGHRVAGHAA